MHNSTWICIEQDLRRFRTNQGRRPNLSIVYMEIGKDASVDPPPPPPPPPRSFARSFLACEQMFRTEEKACILISAKFETEIRFLLFSSLSFFSSFGAFVFSGHTMTHCSSFIAARNALTRALWALRRSRSSLSRLGLKRIWLGGISILP